MAFTEAYAEFLRRHAEERSGEHLRRLREGHGYAEKLFLELGWWPAFGHFDCLHPEYEMRDFEGGFRYLDFAYIRPPFCVCIEIDGYGPHSRNIDCRQFADQLMRQNQLVIDGWIVIRFSYDDVAERPRRCQQIMLQLMGRLFGEFERTAGFSAAEKEIVRLAIAASGTFTPADVCERLGVSRNTTCRLLAGLVAKNVLSPASGQLRIRRYRLNADQVRYFD